GLCRLTPARFTTYTTQQGLSCNNVMAVCEDRLGTMNVATWGGGLNRLEANGIKVITSTNGLTHDSVLAPHEGRDGSLWLGMDFGGGLNRLREGGQNSFPRQ